MISAQGLNEGGNHLEDHLRWLLDRLQPHAPTIRSICSTERLTADFYCGYFMGQANSSFGFGVATLAGTAALEADIGLEIYAEMAELELGQWVNGSNT